MTPIGTPDKITEGFMGKEGKITTQIYKGNWFMAERPELTFRDYIKYFEQIPQVQHGLTAFRDLVLGTQLNINVDEKLPQSKRGKELIDEWVEDTDFFSKLQSVELTTSICGVGLLEKLDENNIIDVEEVDMRSIVEKNRDNYGKTLNYIQNVNGEKILLKPSKFIEFEYQRISKGKWAIPPHHSLCIPRTVGDRIMPSILDCLVISEDAMTAIIHNHAFPLVQITYEGMSDRDLEKEASKWKKWKPGDKLLGTRQPKIDIVETRGDSKYEQYQNHMDTTMEIGLPFPIEIMTGDFTSRASSDTTKSLTMQRVKSRQLYLSNKLKNELFDVILEQNNIDPEQVGLQVSFGTSEPVQLDVNTAIQLKVNNLATTDEIREYLKQHTDFEAFDTIQEPQQDLKQAELDAMKAKAEAYRKVTAKEHKVPDKIQERADQIKDQIFSEKVEKAITERLNAEIAKIQETIEDKKFNRKAKTEILEVLKEIKKDA